MHKQLSHDSLKQLFTEAGAKTRRTSHEHIELTDPKSSRRLR
jgi:hypothetical protein